MGQLSVVIIVGFISPKVLAATLYYGQGSVFSRHVGGVFYTSQMELLTDWYRYDIDYKNKITKINLPRYPKGLK